MTLLVHVPEACTTEIRWVCEVIFGNYLGLEFALTESADPGYHIELENKFLYLPDVFFKAAKDAWLQPQSLPSLPLATWDIATIGLNVPFMGQSLPVLYGKPKFEIHNHAISIDVDIFGTFFFMLSRYEEAILSDCDEHGRFPATASIAHRFGFLDRPIADEYVEVLWAAMQLLWPALERKLRQPRTLVSCDVDNPYVCGSKTVFGLLKRLGGDVVKRRSLDLTLQTLSRSMRRQPGDYSRDSYLNAIDWIMDVNEKAGNCVAFYFITAQSHPTLDGCYNMDAPVIRGLLRRITARGHEIGLHASYNTYQDAAQTCREADILRQTMAEEGIQQAVIGGRQHFLRWQTPITACNLEAAGMDYDSTLTFADRPGFRCGTCHEYPMYDLVERRVLKLRQRPLIVMECSVIAKRYMGMGYREAALELMSTYKRTCHRFGGDFTLLWHNSHMTTVYDKRFYQELIK